ncbi:MAG: tail fiber domain-containing protein [Bacillota bacterium]
MGKEFKRMRYFDGLFLKAEDYNLDQEFNLRLQRLHNRYLHTWGIVCGLEVEPVAGEHMKVTVSEGLALNRTIVKGESISQEILIYDGHPHNPVDLSEYNANENIYIMVSYEETTADRDAEKGQGEEIHIWEMGRISHSTQKPTDRKYIILARVVPKRVGNETIIDSTCIFDTDSDQKRTPLRIYAGAAGRKIVAEKFIVRAKSGDKLEDMDISEDKLESMPSMYTLQEGKVLEVNAPNANFTGSVDIRGDLVVYGELTMKSSSTQNELLVANSFVQVNSPNGEDEWKSQDGGLEVFRGGPGVAPDARIVWSESEDCWKVGEGNDLWRIAYGPKWERLIKNDFADELHMHSQLSSPKGASISFNNMGSLFVNSELVIKDEKTIWLKARDKDSFDSTHGIGWFGEGKPFANVKVDGPVVFGNSGGMLGTKSFDGKGFVQKSVLSWNNQGNVGIGTVNPASDKLDVSGSLRVLSGSNPIRFTSVWTAFPDSTINQAEICNDTTYHKTLMIVGNQSAGQGRKVSIWDRLDVNGFLYVNGSMQLSQALIPSAGNENNGIIFPNDPGGGLGDGARIKYYPRKGESCTLEIRTSNDPDDNISLIASGNVGIGTLNPNEKLDVTGWTRLLSETNPIRFTSRWTGFPDATLNQAEICNDTTNYKALMIVGNRSANQGRKVAIWDRLDVNGFLQVNGNAQITGDLQINGTIKTAVLKFDGQFNKLDVANYFNATVRCADFCIGYSGRRGSPGRALVDYGNCLVINFGQDWPYTLVHGNLHVSNAITPSAGRGHNGIIFPSDPGGGRWDSAWIKYYPYSGENCVLDIGVSNDWGDRINIHASGGVYVHGDWYYWSSREYKENISDLSTKEAKQLLDALNPVSFKYKDSTRASSMGFIAEEVPNHVADPEHRAICPMDIIAVLTSVVKDQQKAITRLQKQIASIAGTGK